MSKAEDVDPVAEAEAAAVEAEQLVTAVEDRIIAGDQSVTHADLSEKISLARFAHKLVEAAKTRAAAAREAEQAKAVKDLKATILAEAPATGDELLKLLDVGFSSLLEFVDRADAHDQQIRQWGIDAGALGVPGRGVVSPAHENMGTAAGGDILVGDIRVTAINAKNVLRFLFQAVDNGILPLRSEEYLQSARSIVSNHGKAVV